MTLFKEHQMIPLSSNLPAYDFYQKVMASWYKVDISPHNTRVFAKAVQGGLNVQFRLHLEVEAWMDQHDNFWLLRDGDRQWHNIPEIQIWFQHRRLSTNSFEHVNYGPAEFYFKDPSVATLFKLTWA